MDENARSEFEAWAATKGMAMHLARAESGLYESRVTQNYMDCWMASQAKKADELEALREFKRHMVEMREADGFESWAEVLVTVDRLKAEVEALRNELEPLGGELEKTELRALKYIHRFNAATDLGRELRVALEAIVALDDPTSAAKIAHDALEPFRAHAIAKTAVMNKESGHD